MSFFKLLDQINTENFNEEQTDIFMDRKKALQKMTNFSKKMALSAIPLGALVTYTSTPAVAQSSGPSDVEILNFALTLEFLERNFYNMGVSSGVIPDKYSTVFTQIRDHERDHVAFLTDAVDSAGGTPVTEDDFDFDYTGGNGSGDGPFDPFNNFAQFAVIAQGFEDTGVRAYKGQAANIDAKQEYLGAALRIHSVEARHASKARRIVGELTGNGQQGWILGAGENAPDPIKAVYAAGDTYNLSEGNTNQAGVDVSQFVSNEAATESFDEPLGMPMTLNIADPFIAGDQSS